MECITTGDERGLLGADIGGGVLKVALWEFACDDDRKSRYSKQGWHNVVRQRRIEGGRETDTLRGCWDAGGRKYLNEGLSVAAEVPCCGLACGRDVELSAMLSEQSGWLSSG